MEPVTEPHPSSSNSNYAFITHSQETLPRNLPPSIDNATLARRRRRRTSAHDQAILEEEYRQCDRPDKTRRKEITHRVQMGEKEVQIWFQNKRQSARRKAKPLLPHEIIPNAPPYSGLAIPPSSQYSFTFSSSQGQGPACFDSDAAARRSRRHHHHHHHRRRRASVSSGIDCTSPPLPACSFSSDVSASRESAYLGLSDDDDDDDDDLDLDLDLDLDPDDRYHDRYDDDNENEDEDEDEDENEDRYESSKRQKLASRSSPPVFSPARHLPASLPGPYDLPEPEMTTSAHQRLQDVLSSTPAPPTRSVNPRRTNPPTTPHQPPRLLKRTSSIRLSTSLEGKATVVLDEAPESPLPLPLPPGLPSSQPLPIPASVPRSTGPQRRVVDSKIWEFYCDNQAMIRSPGHPHLQPAEAKQALGLLRNKTKPAPSSSPITQRKKPAAHRRRRHRQAPPPPPSSSSSPTKPKRPRKPIAQCTARPRKLPPPPPPPPLLLLLRDPGHESDKENRPPGAPVSPPPEPSRRVVVADAPRKSRKRKRHGGGGETRRILADVPPLPSSSSHDADMDSSQPARVDEMECVENLLSLRGGTWR